MQWTSVISRADRAADAVGDVVEQLWRRLDGPPDLVLAFASRHLATSIADVPRELSRAFSGATLAGCLAHSVVGAGHELEREPALAVIAARLPEATTHSVFVTEAADLRALDVLDPARVRALMIIADGSTFEPELLVDELDHRFPDAPKFGGLASGGIYPGANALFAQDRALRQGAVVVAFEGALAVQTLVSQGCRPVGPRLRVTQSQNTVLLGTDAGRPSTVLQEVIAQLSPDQQRNAQNALHIGIRVPGARDDFLIRPLLGVDPNTGALSLNERVRPGDVVQFQVRDPASSTADLRDVLAHAERDRAAGALLFTCIGRGERFFGAPDHDVATFAEFFEDLPLAGFFCSGEVGPVGSRTFLHAYTSTFVVFRPSDP